MPTASSTQIIDKPLEEVFQTVTDVTTFPDWNLTTTSARKLTEGEIGNNTRFEMAIRGFGKQELTLQEFEHNKRVRLVPTSKMFSGGHRFVFSAEGNKTRIDHELEMTPRGLFKLFSPLMGMMSRKNLKDTSAALQHYLERE